jgi:integrase
MLEGQPARQLVRQLERLPEASPATPADAPWDAFEQSFLAHQRALKPAATVELYAIALRLFRRTARPRDLAGVTRAVLEDFTVARLRQGAAPATVNRDLRHLKAALNWAARRGLIARIPDFTGLFLRVPKKKPVVMPDRDFLAIVAAAEAPDTPVTRRSGRWWRTFLYLGYYLGLRRGELLALTWRDIDWETNELRVQAATSKSRCERVLPLPVPIAQLLRDELARVGPLRSNGSPSGGADAGRADAGRADAGRAEAEKSGTAAVLPWPFDTFNPFYDDWHLLQNAARIPTDRRYTPKSLRSSCASLMIAASVPTMVVKDFLGHAKVTTTETYYVNTQPALRAAANLRAVRWNRVGLQGTPGNAEGD